MIFLKKFWGGKKALVLGGGSARGLAHIGVIKVLQEENITFDAVFGTSMGAIIGALYAAGVHWQEMMNMAADFSFFQVFKWRISKTGLIRSHQLIDFLRKELPVNTFEELSLPLYVLAVDITHGREAVFNEGDLNTKIAASCAIPGIFTPVKLNGALYVDGGMMYNVPVEIAKEKGYKKTLAVNVLNDYHEGEVGNIVEVISRSLLLLARRSNIHSIKNATLVLNPHLSEFGSMDYQKAEWIILEGEESALRNIKMLRAHFK